MWCSLLFICSGRKRNYFGSLLPLCAKGKYSREYSWAFKKQTCEKGDAGAWGNGGRVGGEGGEGRALGGLEGQAVGSWGELVGKPGQNNSGNLRPGGKGKVVLKPCWGLCVRSLNNTLQETQGMIGFFKLLLVDGLFPWNRQTPWLIFGDVAFMCILGFYSCSFDSCGKRMADHLTTFKKTEF